MVYLLYYRLDTIWETNRLAGYLRALPDRFVRKVAQYRYPEDRQTRIAGRLLLQEGLRELGCKRALDDIRYSTYGKPYFPGCDIRFNIAHSRATVTCVLSDESEVGIDTEERSAIQVSDYERLIPNHIYKEITRQPDRVSAFLSYWTSLEASLKAEGKGFLLSTDNIVIDNQYARVRNRTWYLSGPDLFPGNTTTIASFKPVEGYQQRELFL